MLTIKLNKQQLQAVRHSKCPLLIIAGAGTGKTTVITERIKHLLKVRNLDPQQILATTFTDKAAQEMLTRLDQVMPLGYHEPWLATFHKICDRILKAESLEIGLDPGFKIISHPQQWILIKNHLFDFKLNHFRPLGNPTKFIHALLTFFSRAQDEDLLPPAIIKYAQSLKSREERQRLLEVGEAFQTYQDLKIKNSFLDFGDLITQTLYLFRTRPLILKKYQNQFKHILVDEFQDTNLAQYQLIKLLAPPKIQPDLTVVADDDQAIFRWRGASVFNVVDFQKAYPKARNIVLTQNYRSFQPILDAAYKLIQNNNPDRLESRLKINKKLSSTRKPQKPPTPQSLEFATHTDEVDWIIKTIKDFVKKSHYTFKDFAILTRANSQLDPFVSAFKRHGMPYQLIGNRGLFDQPEIRFLLSFLKATTDPHDSTSLFNFIQDPIFNLQPDYILNQLQKARLNKTSLWEILIAKKSLPDSDRPLKPIKSAQKQIASDSPSKIIFDFLTSLKYVNKIIQKDSLRSQLKIKNLNLFLNLIKNFEAQTPNTNLIELVDYFDALQEAGENPAQAEIEDIDTIYLTTIHSAKGLEFPVVFMPSLIVGRFPSINRSDPIQFPDKLIKEKLPQGDHHLQEERRLFYVALTRARDHLYLTHARDYGSLRQRHPSGFLAETGFNIQKVKSTPQLSLLANLPTKSPKTIMSSRKLDFKYLSYSQIDTFKTCPLKYKYRYLLQVPSLPHHALSFGQSIHDTLRRFHSFELKKQKPTLKDLLFLYQQYFRSQGYLSQTHKQKRFQSGKKALRQYFKVYKQKLGTPIELEKSFRLSISGIPLIGKIDRIDNTPKGYEIIDYKTGSSKDKKQVDVDEQLSIYAAAAKYALNINPKKLSLYFLESNQKVSTTRSDKDIKSTIKRLEKTIAKIKSSTFPAAPNAPFPCSYCEYNTICPFAARK